MTTLRVALVDDHLLFREGLRAMLASAPDLRVVAEASNAQEALPAVRASQPEVVVLDVMLPGVSGIGVARELLREDPKRRVLALSMVADEAHVADALQAGVDRKSTRLNSSHLVISYAVFCLKKKNYSVTYHSTLSPSRSIHSRSRCHGFSLGFL